jgi:hypothetical protein
MVIVDPRYARVTHENKTTILNRLLLFLFVVSLNVKKEVTVFEPFLKTCTIDEIMPRGVKSSSNSKKRIRSTEDR